MFFLKHFRKKDQQPRATHPAIEKVKRKLAGFQEWIVKQLSRYEQRLSLSEKKVCLVLFCLLMGSLSTYWLYQGIAGRSTVAPTYMQPQSIVRPHDSKLPDSLNVNFLEELKQKREVLQKNIDSTNQ